MNRALYSGNGYVMSLGTAAGEATESKSLDASTGYSESISVNGASNIRITINGTAGSTGTVEVRYSTTKAFTTFELAASLSIPAATYGTVSFTDVTPIGFVRVYNLTNNAITATLQHWV